MVYQRVANYLWLKGDTYYFNGRVPKDMQGHYTASRIVICLKTTRKDTAVRSAKSIAQRLEDYWLSLRLAKIDIPALHLLRDKPLLPSQSSCMHLTEALDLYIKLKGVGKNKVFKRGAERNIQQECLYIDDEARWLVALISDTGMRLSEATGLHIDDIKLDCEIPHIDLKPHAWRGLKTKGSQRQIPLVGASLWAAKRVKANNTASPFAFPNYKSAKGTNANSASAAINKWLKPRVPEGCVIHSFRHSLRDGLRAVQCPSDMIDQIGGWTTAGVGQGYGEGYRLMALNKFLIKFTL